MNLKEASSECSLSGEGVSARPVVAIYADPLLAPSMPWVRAQAESLRLFLPYYVGPRALAAGGLELPHDRVFTIHRMTGIRGRIREVPFKVFGFAPVFLRRIKRFEPALVHAHSGPGGVAALPIASYLGVPLVTTFHGGEVTTSDSEMAGHKHYSARAYWSRRKHFQSKGSLFIAVSKFVYGKLLEQGYPEDRTVLHYIGVDTEFFKPDRQVPREPIVLFVGTLHEGKGCEYAIRAMAKVQSLLPDVELVILGDGTLRASLERLAGEKLRRYKFVGTQPPEVVRSWMNRARVFVAPSVTADTGWTEAFGIVFAEAQAMCLPVVSFVSGGIPEAVNHGETGLLTTERNWEGLANNIQILLQNDAMRGRMAEAGRQRVCRFFNLDCQTRLLEDIYEEVLNHRAVEIREGTESPMRTRSGWIPKGDNALLMPYLPADSSGQSHSLKEAVRVCRKMEVNGHRFQLLDLGCGGGKSQVMLQGQLSTNFHWIGLDIADSPEVQLRVAKGQHLCTYDGIRVPFRDHSIDVVYSHQVFEHVREPRSLLQEVYRILRPGGFFVGSTSHLEAFHSRSVWNYTPYGFAELIREAGFSSVKLRPGIDGFTLLARRLVGMTKVGDLFSPFFQRESPFNIAVEAGGRLLKLNVERRCALKLLFCGHFVFVAQRKSKEKQDVSESSLLAGAA